MCVDQHQPKCMWSWYKRKRPFTLHTDHLRITFTSCVGIRDQMMSLNFSDRVRVMCLKQCLASSKTASSIAVRRSYRNHGNPKRLRSCNCMLQRLFVRFDPIITLLMVCTKIPFHSCSKIFLGEIGRDLQNRLEDYWYDIKVLYGKKITV